MSEHSFGPIRPGWSEPQPKKLPPPTIWPTLTAMATVVMGWGTVTSLYITLLGLFGFIASIIGWVGEFHHDRHE